MPGLDRLSAGELAQRLVESYGNLRAQGWRATLALLGIAMGCAAVVALLNIGRSAAADALQAFQGMGTDILVANLPFAVAARTPLPAVLDIRAVRQAVTQLTRIAPLSQYSATVTYRGRHADASLIGTTRDLADIMGLHLRSGRFLSAFDHRPPFAVVGARVARDLAGQGRALQVDDLLHIGDYLFQVIGIAAPQPANGLLPIAVDDAIFIPGASLRRLTSNAAIGSVLARVAADADPLSTAEAFKSALSHAFGGREVTVQIPRRLLDGLERQSRTFTWLLAGLGGIALLVGGVGVMNVMLMSVAERRREIGVRMALGACRRDICLLFLLEAVLLSLAGALAGALLGVAVAWVFIQCLGWPWSLSLDSLLLGIGSALSIGLTCGLYPALMASRLSPVVALRDD